MSNTPKTLAVQIAVLKAAPKVHRLFVRVNLKVDVTQREMLPIDRRGRRLIVIHKNSVIETFALDHTFGGSQSRATVELSTLGETLQELLGTSACEGKKWLIANGLKKKFEPLHYFD